MHRFHWAGGLALLAFLPAVHAQVIEFQSNGFKFQTLTKSGVTIMYTHLANHIHEYSILQTAVSNGSHAPYTIRPEDFSYIHPDGVEIHATPAHTVIDMLLQKGSGGDVVKLVTTYVASLYGNQPFKSTNGYEQRRESALAISSTKLRAAAAASALALVQTRLVSGESTDGAVFFSTDGKPLTGGRLVIRTNTDIFEFNPE